MKYPKKKKVRPDRVLTAYERVKRSRLKKKYGHRIVELENAILQDFATKPPSREQITIIRRLYPLFMFKPMVNQYAFKYDYRDCGLPSVFDSILKGKKITYDIFAADKKIDKKYIKNYEKKCYFCKQFKNINDYHRNKASLDGLQNLCKECAKKKRKERYNKN